VTPPHASVTSPSTITNRTTTLVFHIIIFCSAVVTTVLGVKHLKRAMTVEAAKPFNNDSGGYTTEGYKYNGVRKDGNIQGSDVKDNSGKANTKRQRFNFVADVVDSVGDSVVCIEIKDNTLIDWITGKPEVMSNGSGFIISEDGVILTNAHVVVGRNNMCLTVKLHDGRTFPASIEDVDMNSDLAVIRIKARGLPTMPLGSSSETRIGEWVVALGSPLSLTNTVTAGVVSSVSRKANELGIANDISYIQTDAAITFGNSGGPLVNLDGEAIGINSMKVAAGISFAIPIDYVKGYLVDVEKRRVAGQKKPKRRYMGATLLTLTEDLVRELHASNVVIPQMSRGVMVWKVVIGSPAYKCGLKPGDIIYRVNGVDITSATPIFEALQRAESLKFNVIRRDSSTPNFACVMYPEEVPE